MTLRSPGRALPTAARLAPTLLLLSLSASPALAQPAGLTEPPSLAALNTLSLIGAINLTLDRYPDLDAARAALDEATARLEQTQRLPNPELELLTGRLQGRRDDVPEGARHNLGLTQPLVWPAARAARFEAGRQEVEVAKMDYERIRLELAHQVKLAYLEVLRAQNLLRLAEEDYQHILGVRDRIKAKVQVGESPRYEAVKAEAEALTAARQVEAAKDQLRASQALLAHLTGRASSALSPLKSLPPEKLELAELHQAMVQGNPRYAQARARVAAARAGVEEARADRLPPPTLKAQFERAPDSDAWLIGLALPVPLFDQRQGVVAAAEARLDRSLAEGRLELLQLERALEQAFYQYRRARTQWQALEGGLLTEAKAALTVAEEAFRAGERVILDVLDARRTLRAVRVDGVHALFDTYAALVELERLTTRPLLAETAE
ncbi:TolC family protein [Thiofaba sp. EF100]|uniref:TolC family protein n=1 Tax=Thiofaba sp. EF100 TaxID=3121274 RepID=UPI003221D25D